MTETEVLRILARGEDSYHPFKREANNTESLSEPAWYER